MYHSTSFHNPTTQALITRVPVQELNIPNSTSYRVLLPSYMRTHPESSKNYPTPNTPPPPLCKLFPSPSRLCAEGDIPVLDRHSRKNCRCQSEQGWMRHPTFPFWVMNTSRSFFHSHTHTHTPPLRTFLHLEAATPYPCAVPSNSKN